MGYTLLSIDPGFTSFGYTISRIELGGHMILQRLGVEHPTAEADRAARKEMVAKLGRPMVQMIVLREMLRRIIQSDNVEFFACEAAYYNPRRPSAFASLMRALTVLDIAVFDLKGQRVMQIPPSVAKQAVFQGDADKNDVKRAVLKHPDIDWSIVKQTCDIDTFTDHTYDSVAIGYAFAQLNKDILRF